jgi:hypothetical protein
MGRSRWWARADRPAMASLAGERMMSAVLAGGNVDTGTSAFHSARRCRGAVHLCLALRRAVPRGHEGDPQLGEPPPAP